MSITERFRRSVAPKLSPQSLQHATVAGPTGVEVEKEDEVIKNFLSEKDVPAWFRGSSQFQLEAADALLNALRDDTEQQTTHRVRTVLTQIGIQPMISKRETQLLMRLSRGNDLAFLWFLLEMRYKTPGPLYTVNEQLILSAIVHLDMITTLRELDKVLPPASLGKKEWEKRKKLEAMKQVKPKPKKPKQQYVLPYFEKLVRPRHFGKPLTIPIPDFKVSFGSYENYQDPNYVVHNENNRWYADYELNPGKRIAQRIITDEITNIFDDYSASTDRAEKSEVLCEHHKTIKELEISLENELKVIARDRCLAHFDIDKRKREERLTRIREMMDKDVCRFLCKFRKMAEKTEKQIVVMTIENDCDCQHHLVDSDDIEECRRDDDEARQTIDSERGIEKTQNRTGSMASTGSRIEWSDRKKEKDLCERIKEKGDKKDEKKKSACLPFGLGQGGGDCQDDLSSVESQHFTERRTSKPRISIVDNMVHITDTLCPNTTAQLTVGADVTPTPSETFFEAPQAHMPYQFDYNKIFSFKEVPTDKINIKRVAMEAIDSELELSENVKESRLDLDQAVRSCAQRTWKDMVKGKNAEIAADEERKRDFPEDHEKSPLNYNLEYYDPNDKDLMRKMLKDALEYISKNPKFVLATLPDSHKLPMLREWITQRYGKVYTKDERYRSFHMSTKIFKALDKLAVVVPLPTTAELGSELFVDYSCRDYLLKKANFIKQEYYRRWDASIMDQSRVFWFAMRPYLCSNGPPRNTYYAYMPARDMDILRFRIWKPSEYMNAVGAWERRQLQKSTD